MYMFLYVPKVFGRPQFKPHVLKQQEHDPPQGFQKGTLQY